MIRRWASSDTASNLLWLVVSVLLATGVWFIAVTSADPIQNRRFSAIPIEFTASDSTVMTGSSRRDATVTIQGSQATVSSRRAEHLDVHADLSRLGPGTHTVPLVVDVDWPESDTLRRPVLQVQPSEITVEIEPIESREKKISIELTHAPPIGFQHEGTESDISAVLVSGSASNVAQVVAVLAELDLSTSRNPIDADLRLYAVGEDGNRVDDVKLEPQTVMVSVNITRRDDIKQIAVRPNILLGTQPDGFAFRNYSYDPSTFFISGGPEKLAGVADTLFTDAISLENRRESFVTTVPVQLPDEDLFVMGGDNKVTVTIEIIPIIASRQIDSIEVGHIGLGDDFAVSIVPSTVSAIVTGPVVYVDAMTVDDIQVFVNLNELTPGVNNLEPNISIALGELSEDNVSLSPDVLNVEITSMVEDSEETVEAEPDPTSEG